MARGARSSSLPIAAALLLVLGWRSPRLRCFTAGWPFRAGGQPSLRLGGQVFRQARGAVAEPPAPADVAAPAEVEAPAAEPVEELRPAAELKWALLRLAAALDRGQAYNPTSGEYYSGRVEAARGVINELLAQAPPLPESLEAIDGEWELVFSTVKHGIFRSSPFFLAVQEAFGDREKSELFFKLHELQVMSWGISKVGRVAQYINSTEGRLYSEFDTSLLSLTTIPILGFWKLLPTFGGSVITASSVELAGDRLDMEVQWTEAREVPGLPTLGGLVGRRVPVNAIWQLLPWNGGKKPTCGVTLKYVDEDMRIVADGDGELFVYTRPVDPRGLLP